MVQKFHSEDYGSSKLTKKVPPLRWDEKNVSVGDLVNEHELILLNYNSHKTQKAEKYAYEQ